MTKKIMDIEKKEKEKRAWVRNASIIFLTVMLLLTFFSNTIMNISLAEVRTTQASSGSITTKVRGTGMVASAKIHNVTLNEIRNVEEVKTVVGDTISAGDVLFVLNESESTELTEAQETLEELKRAYQETVLSAGLAEHTSDHTAERIAVSRADQALADARNARSAFGESVMSLSQATEAFRIANAELTEVTAQKTSLEQQLALLDENDSGREALQSQIAQVTSNLEAVDATARAAQNTLDNETNIATADDAIKAAAASLEDAKLALSQAMKTGAKQSAINDLNATAQQRKITEQEEKVAKLQEHSVGREVTAKYGGVVTSVNITAGNDTTPNTPLAQIAVSENGYSSEIIITKDQAQMVKVGDTAEVTANNYTTEITATVDSIRNGFSDGSEVSSDGGSSTDKTVVFHLDGKDLTIGESLNFSLNLKSSNYDVLVPNSAIKTDSNGTFVLMITEKSTPLGTRYIATRVDVQIVENDESHTAVNGSLPQYGSVITTASKTVEPGDYVRLAENN